MKTFGIAFERFGSLNGTDIFSALIYDGLCGIDSKKVNSSTFGFDPGNIGRFVYDFSWRMISCSTKYCFSDTTL